MAQRSGGEMLHEVPGEQRVDVERRSTALADAMRAIGVRHEVEGLVERDQAVHQAFRALVMHIIIAGAMHDQQASPEPLGLIDRRGTLVARAVRRAVQETHVALGHGPFIRTQLHESLAVLQAFMSVVAVMCLVLSAVTADRHRSDRERIVLLHRERLARAHAAEMERLRRT